MTYSFRHFRGFLLIRWLIIHYEIEAFFKSIWKAAKDWLNLVFIIIWWLILGSPTWIGYILYFITKNVWHLTYANAVMLFWSGPFTPMIPLAITLGLGTRAIFKKIFRKEAIRNESFTKYKR